MSSRGLRPLRQAGFRRLIAGQLTSNLGDAFYAVALPWYVLADHGGPLELGEVLAAYGIARTAALAVGGQLSDRFAPWTVMMSADLIRTVAMTALTASAVAGRAHLVLLLPIAAIVGAGEGIFLPGSSVIVPALLPDEDLQAGNALASAGMQLATLVGPALGGVAVALLGPAPAFGIDTASFLLSALSLARIHAGTRDHAGQPSGDGVSLRRILRTERAIALIFAINVAANLGSGGMGEVALPSLAHGPLHGGASGYGVLVASFAAGALVGTVTAAQVGRPRRPAVVASIGFLTEGICMAVVPYLGGTLGAAVALLAYGTLNGFANVLTLTAMQRWAPRALLGRVMGFLMLGSYGVFPISVLLGGVIVHADGPAVFFPIAAALVILAVGAALTQREWREFGATPASAAA